MQGVYTSLPFLFCILTLSLCMWLELKSHTRKPNLYCLVDHLIKWSCKLSNTLSVGTLSAIIRNNACRTALN